MTSVTIHAARCSWKCVPKTSKNKGGRHQALRLFDVDTGQLLLVVTQADRRASSRWMGGWSCKRKGSRPYCHSSRGAPGFHVIHAVSSDQLTCFPHENPVDTPFLPPVFILGLRLGRQGLRCNFGRQEWASGVPLGSEGIVAECVIFRMWCGKKLYCNHWRIVVRIGGS